ncbi:phage scaffolding protein [Veillonella magna]|uniref:phage scaffolding protein n=1 Tax=Veillonella magna TaxID=464322 RepID=UPI0026DB1E56|nr:phage scaffolding protein [Veillonella magna]
MTLDELLAKLGIADEKKANATAEINSFLKGQYVPVARFNEVSEEKKKLTETVTERDKQLTELQKAGGDTDALKEQINKLQEANKAASKKFEEDMKALKVDNAIRLAVSGDAQDVDIVAGLINRQTIVLGDDGKLTGLQEQLETLKKEKAFLFKAKEEPKSAGYTPKGGAGPATKNPFAKETFNLTEQGRLFRENPEQARQLAAEAGVVI